MKPTKKETVIYDLDLTEEDIAAIRRSEEEFKRGECYDMEEVFEKLRNKYPNSENLTTEDIEAIKRSHEEIERGECYDIEEVFEELRNLYPNSQVYN